LPDSGSLLRLSAIAQERASILIGTAATVKLVAPNVARLPRLNLGDTEGVTLGEIQCYSGDDGYH
jgi:hypothetical protein